jgi:glycosyltransferase involved in cell wall biosynthesis
MNNFNNKNKMQMPISSITKIALVWNAPSKLIDITTRFEPYVEGLRSIGIEAITVCPAGMEIGYPYCTVVFNDYRELTFPDFWQNLSCNNAFIITWHRMTDILLAMREAGMRAIAIGDSDGLVSIRAHPWDTLRYKISEQKNYRHKIGAAKLWLSNWLFRGVAHDLELIAATEAAHIFGLPNVGGVEQFRQFLINRGATVAANKVAAIPYPVAEAFCTEPIKTPKANRVIAVGRWDSYQKNAPLLAVALERLTSYGCNTEFLIVGNGAVAAFSSVAKLNSAIHLLGFQPREQIMKLMSDCRSVLIPSRWESGPIVANEMLALGGTVVGTPIPSIKGITADGRFGRISQKHCAEPFAKALLNEMDAWGRGERDPQAIAAHWRTLVSPVSVAGRIIDLLGLTPNYPS